MPQVTRERFHDPLIEKKVKKSFEDEKDKEEGAREEKEECYLP